MKRTIAITMAAMLLIVLLLSACGGLSGTYNDESGLVSMTFKGNKVTMTAFGMTVGEGTYKVSGNKITVKIAGEETTSSFKKDGKNLIIDGEKWIKK